MLENRPPRLPSQTCLYVTNESLERKNSLQQTSTLLDMDRSIRVNARVRCRDHTLGVAYRMQTNHGYVCGKIEHTLATMYPLKCVISAYSRHLGNVYMYTIYCCIKSVKYYSWMDVWHLAG